MNKKGFTLFEIMVVVAVIGIFSSTAIPSIRKARGSASMTACIANLKNIEKAKTLFFMYSGGLSIPNGMNDLVPDYLKKTPYCNDKAYVIGDYSTLPTCKTGFADHTLS